MRNVTDAFATFLKHQISAPNRLSGMEHGLELAVYWGDTLRHLRPSSYWRRVTAESARSQPVRRCGNGFLLESAWRLGRRNARGR